MLPEPTPETYVGIDRISALSSFKAKLLSGGSTGSYASIPEQVAHQTYTDLDPTGQIKLNAENAITAAENITLYIIIII